MKKVLENCSANKETWLELKSKTIGGSEIAGVLGLNPYVTPLQLWLQKTGKEAATTENEYMWLGSRLEPIVAELYAKREGKELQRADFMAVAEQHEYASATPDYLAKDGGSIVEIKTCGIRSAAKWENAVPDTAHAQLIWQLGICGIPAGTVCCLPANSPERFISRDFAFDPHLYNFMLERAGEFMELVKRDTPPPAQASDKEVLEVQKLVKMAKGEELKIVDLQPIQELLELTGRYQSISGEYRELKERCDHLADRIAEEKAKLLMLMGAANGVKIGEFEAIVKKIERKEYTAKASSYLQWTVKMFGEKL